jgi:S-layer protein
LDVIDGGAGEDTLQIENTGGKNTLTGEINNVENLTLIGAGDVNNNSDVNVSDFSGTVTLSKTADSAVGVTNVTGQTLALNEVADGTTLTAAYGAAQESATLSNTEAAGNAEFSIAGAGAALETVSLSTDATVAAKTVTVADTGNTVKTANIAASANAAVNVTSTALENVAVSGAGQVTFTGTAPSKTLDSTASTGGVVYAAALGDAVAFTGGAGDDTVSFDATTKAQTTGAGDDTVILTDSALGTDGSIDAGEGADTLQMAAADAATASGDSNFEGTISNFDKLSLTTTVGQTVDLANLDDIDYVIAAGVGATLTVDNMASGGTFEFADASTTTIVNVADAAAGEADVLNAKVSNGADINAGTLTVADVETVNIESDDTAITPDGSVSHTLILAADEATAVNITGDAQVDLTLTGSTKVETVDASANTAGVTVDLTVAEGITFTGSAENDTVTLGDLSSVTGGEGDDTFVVGAPAAGNKYGTIEDFNAEEDTLQFADKGTETFNDEAINLAGGTAVFQDYLDTATAGDGSTDSALSWFEFGGDTFVVADNSTEATFVGGADAVVQLTGSVDLSETTVSDFTFA